MCPKMRGLPGETSTNSLADLCASKWVLRWQPEKRHEAVSLLFSGRSCRSKRKPPGPHCAGTKPLHPETQALRWALMRSGTLGNPNSAKPRDTCFTSEGGKRQRGAEKRARSASFSFASTASTPPAAPALRWPVFTPTFPGRFFPGDGSAELDKHFAQRERR